MNDTEEMECKFCGAALDETEMMYTLKDRESPSAPEVYACEECMQKKFMKVEKH